VALALNWMRLPGAESCIDAGRLARNVEQHLGRSVFASPAVATRSIEAWVEPARPGWHVGLRASNADGDTLGQRDLTSPEASCSSLDRAIVIAVGLLAQEAQGPATTPPDSLYPVSPAPTLARPPEIVLPPKPPDVPQSAPPIHQGELRAELGPAFDVGWGVLPRTAIGLATRAAIHLPRWGTVDIGSRLWLPQAEGSADARGSFSRIDLGIGLCPFVTGSDAAQFGACAGVTGGVVTAQGTGSGASETLDRPSFEAYGRLLGLVRIFSPLWLMASANVGAPLTRWTFYHRHADGSETDVWAMPALTGGVQIGLLLHFGP